jgi:FRG domain
MRPENVIAEIPCETAEDLLREMSPSAGRVWASSRSGLTQREWIFRGVPDANFELRPSAFRAQAFTSFIPGQVERRIDDANEQRGMEDSFLTQFCTEADRMEIQVPSDGPELRDSRRALLKYDPHEFPPIEKLHMYALAQHYGVPTRLLDWSRHPLVAAYFAVRDVAMMRTKRPGVWSISGNDPCAVWALDASFLRVMIREATNNKAIDPAVYLVTAPYATNPNLAAQGGLFTVVQPRSGDPHPIPDLDVALLKMADHAPKDWDRHAPVLMKFTLPARQVRVALRMLDAEGITAATIRPGIAGVVDAMRERWAHQWAPPHDRS